jgi:hypothetical protein
MTKGLTISYKSKAWRVVTRLETKVILSELMTYKQANSLFNITVSLSEYPNGGKLLGCWIVAQESGIALVER